MQVVELVSAGEGVITGYDMRRRWKERGHAAVSLNEALAWLRSQRGEVPYRAIVNPTVEEKVPVGSLKAKAMPVLRRGPGGRWEHCHMLLATYHHGPIAVVAMPVSEEVLGTSSV